MSANMSRTGQILEPRRSGRFVEGVGFRFTRFDEPTLRVVETIAPERELDGVKYERSIAERWIALTWPQPLHGAAAMADTVDGGIVLAAQLAARAPWAEPLARRVEAECRLSLGLGRPWLLLPPLLLVGPPGAGKSHWGRMLARLSGCGSAALDLGGASDNRVLEGTSRGWSSAQPCWPLTVIDATSCANPVLVVDEIDKAGGSTKNGFPQQTLLAMFEPNTAKAYFDGCLMAPADLSQCVWVMTCNTLETIPKPLLSRVEVVEIAGPKPSHADVIIDSVLADLAGVWDMPIEQLPALPRSTRRVLKDSLASSGSVRLLRRQLRAALAALISHPSQRRLS